VVPIDLLDTLQQTWHDLCRGYDVTSELPDMESLFTGAELAAPAHAAETVLANMVTEMMGCMGRFSPWYKQSAASYGLVLIQGAPSSARWGLSPPAVQRWKPLITALTVAIERNVGLILSATLISDLEPDDPCVMASCACVPPRLILVNRSILVGALITCDACQNPFHLIPDAPDNAQWIDW
jgi:hypothetical protein